MDRRAFIGIITGGLLAAPLIAEAQPAGAVPRIGYLASSPSVDVELFRQALRELGRIEGQNITIEYRWTEGKNERLPQLVAELIKLKVDVIYVWGSVAAALATKEATTTIPIVFQMPGDPVQAGLLTNFARPGGNITGLGGGNIVATKRLSLLKEAVPRATRVAVFLNPRNPPHEGVLKDLEEAARSLKVQLHPVRVSQSGELETALSALTRGRVEALFILGDAMLFQTRTRILAFAAQRRLPASTRGG